MHVAPVSWRCAPTPCAVPKAAPGALRAEGHRGLKGQLPGDPAAPTWAPTGPGQPLVLPNEKWEGLFSKSRTVSGGQAGPHGPGSEVRALGSELSAVTERPASCRCTGPCCGKSGVPAPLGGPVAPQAPSTEPAGGWEWPRGLRGPGHLSPRCTLSPIPLPRARGGGAEHGTALGALRCREGRPGVPRTRGGRWRGLRDARVSRQARQTQPPLARRSVAGAAVPSAAPGLQARGPASWGRRGLAGQRLPRHLLGLALPWATGSHAGSASQGEEGDLAARERRGCLPGAGGCPCPLEQGEVGAQGAASSGLGCTHPGRGRKGSVHLLVTCSCQAPPWPLPRFLVCTLSPMA